METADETEMALGSDMMAVAHEGYRLLSGSGKERWAERSLYPIRPVRPAGRNGQS
jgi:hypothetical protein